MRGMETTYTTASSRTPPTPRSSSSLARPAESEDGGLVPGRVLATRAGGGGVIQYKVSLDGYDSEDDAWIDADDEGLMPYASLGDAKADGQKTAAEKDAARRLAEQRKAEGRRELEAVVGRRD